MPYLPKSYRLLIPVLLVLALSACGLELSGEPEIVSEVEIESSPTPVPVTQAAGTEQPAEPGVMAATPAGAQDALAGDFDHGTQLYLQECASCHGASAGVGPSLAEMRDVAGTRVEGLAAVDYLHQSIVDPGAFIVPGFDDIMPRDYGDRLSEQDITDLIKFIMEFTPEAMMNAAQASAEDGGQGTSPTQDPHAILTASPDAASGSPTEDPHAVLTSVPQGNGTLTVRGQIVQGTDGGAEIPADLPVELYVLDPNSNIAGIYDTTCQGGGSFEFDDVVRGEGFFYLVRTDYAGIPQGAQTDAVEGDEEEINTDVTVYERTSEHDTVAISMARMLVNYAPINEFGIEVRLDLELINTGDRIVASDTLAERGWPISVSVELPVGAFGIQPMQSEGSERYQVDLVDQIPVVQDTWPIRPDQRHTITILYYLPYEDGAVLDQSFGYPVMDASVLLPNDTVEFESDTFDEAGEFRYHVLSGGLRVQELNPSEDVDPDDVTLIKAHDLVQPVGEDGRLTFTLTGRPTRTVDVMNPAAQSSDSGTNPLPYILAGAGLAVLVMGGVLWWRQRSTAVTVPSAAHWRPPGRGATREDLLQALAALEDEYAAGELDEDTYLERREILKDLLIPLMDGDDA